MIEVYRIAGIELKLPPDGYIAVKYQREQNGMPKEGKRCLALKS